MDDTRRYLKKAFIEWLALWVAFNLFLLVEGLTALSFLRDMAEEGNHRCLSLYGPKIHFFIRVFGVVANASFGFAPLVEMYLRIFLGKRLERWRYALLLALLIFWSCWILFYFNMGQDHLRHFLPQGG